MYKQKKVAAAYVWSIFVVCVFSRALHGWTPDNRYVPLFWHSHAPTNYFAIEGFAATASKALNDSQTEIGIAELHGQFNLGELDRASQKAGNASVLPSFLQGYSIPYTVESKLQIQGAVMDYYQQLHRFVGVGISWLIMRVSSHNDFFIKDRDIFFPTTPSLLAELDADRRTLFQALGFTQNHTTQVGFGDFDIFVRATNRWEYRAKCRAIDLGLSLGLLLPSGQKLSNNAPTEIPFGGNGQLGWYLISNGLFELKEDIKVGFYLGLVKRLANTQVRRIPLLKEPQIFGATVGKVHLNQGTTILASPFCMLENLRQGLGVGIQYTLTKHQPDSWRIECSNAGIAPCVEQIQKLSEWASDYVTISAFYDFGKVKPKRSFDPIISFYWDIPSTLFVSSNSVRTHKVSLGLGFTF